MMKLVVLCCMGVAVASGSPVYLAPAAILSAPYHGESGLLHQNLYNYRGPLSLTPGQPANILAADGKPLDTLDVNLDRSVHFIAQALDSGSRILKKRSVTLAVAPGLAGFTSAAAAGNIVVDPNGTTASIATIPIGLSVPLTSTTFSITNPLVAGPIGLSTSISTGSLGVSTPVAAGSVGVAAPTVVAPIISASGAPSGRNF